MTRYLNKPDVDKLHEIIYKGLVYATGSNLSHFIPTMTKEQLKNIDDNPDDPIEKLIAENQAEFNKMTIEDVMKNTFVFFQYQSASI